MHISSKQVQTIAVVLVALAYLTLTCMLIADLWNDMDMEACIEPVNVQNLQEVNRCLDIYYIRGRDRIGHTQLCPDTGKE